MGNIKQKLANIVEAVVELRDEFKVALMEKGVENPGDNIAEYPAAILDIPAGGGGAAGAFGSFRVDWLDYDGSILKTEYVGLGEAATPPLNPPEVFSHDGVKVASFSGWGIPGSVFSNVLCDMQIMAGYEVLTCAARVYAKAGDVVVLPFAVSGGGSVTVDWGEGDPVTYQNGAQLQHTYVGDFAGVVAFDDTYALIYIPNATGVPTCNGVEGVFVHAGGRFSRGTEENLLTHGFDSSTYYICDFQSQPLCSAPRGQRFLCLDSSTPWAVKIPAYGRGNTFTVIDGPSVAGCDNNGYFYETYSAISVPNLFGVYYSNPQGSGIEESSAALSYTTAPFIYNEGMPSVKFGYSGAATMGNGVIYVKATTVDVGVSKCLIAPNATTLKIVGNTRFSHIRIVAPLCEVVEASTTPYSTRYGYLEEITLANGVSISAGQANIVCSYRISPRNVVDVFSKLPAGTGNLYVINRIYDALSADEIAIATEKGYTVSSVNAPQ